MSLLSVGCEMETRIIDPREERLLAALAQSPTYQATPTVIENPDGSETLVLNSAQHLIAHLRRCLIEGRDDLIHEQLLSKRAKESYEQRGRDPYEATEWLLENRSDILTFLNRAGMGHGSPGITSEMSGGVFVLRVSGPAAQQLRFHRLEAIYEDGQYRLLYITR